MIKRILYPIAGSSSVESGLTTALEVATDFNAHLDVIFCRRPFDPDISLTDDDSDTSRLMNAAKSFEKDEKRRASGARKLFNRLTEDRDVPYEQYPTPGNTPAASWEVSSRPPDGELSLRAGAADLVVVGRSSNGVGDVTRSLVETALFGCEQTVLVAPREATPKIGSRVLVAWNRSAPSARAVKSAIPFLSRAEAVTLFMIDTGAKVGPDPDAVASYLSLHDVDAEVRTVPETGQRVSDILLTEAMQMSADLLVMGAFSHSRLREFVLGGVTRDILSSAALPVLMAH